MITKRDCILLLSDLEAHGVPAQDMLNKTLASKNVNLDVIKFINDHRQFDANKFYEKLRKSYNDKRSVLYKNIVTCDEKDCTDTALTTLASLNLQILLYMKNVTDAKMFMSHTRLQEINEAMLHYSKTFDIVPCIKVLYLIKADLKAFEYINNN